MYRAMLVASLVVFATLGCSKTKSITITSDPAGSEIYFDGQKVGETPFSRTVEFKSKPAGINVSVKKHGYEPGRILLTYEPKTETRYHVNLEEKPHAQHAGGPAVILQNNMQANPTVTQPAPSVTAPAAVHREPASAAENRERQFCGDCGWRYNGSERFCGGCGQKR